MAERGKEGGVRHPIRVVADRTGVTAHVLRAWERRYAVVSPTRSEGGQRFYSDDDVVRLSLLAKLSQVGRSVGSVAHLPTLELKQLVAQDAEKGQVRPQPSLDRLDLAMAAVREMTPDRLHSLLRRALLSLGTIDFLEQVLSPLLVQIGAEWHAGDLGVAHEHAASAAIQRLLGELIAELNGTSEAPCVLLATPSGQRHSQGAMIAGAVAAHDGWHVIWLGDDLPGAQIAAAAREHDPDIVGLSVGNTDDLASLRRELLGLRKDLNARTPLLIGGSGAPSVNGLPEIFEVRDLVHWRSLLRAHAPARRKAPA